MQNTIRAAARRVILPAALVFAPAALGAQALPAAADLMAKYTAAVGGEAAFAALPGMHMKGSFSLPAQGISAPIEVWAGRPKNMLMVTSIPGMGEVRQGYDGTTAWAVDFMQGARILTGTEALQMVDDAGIDSSIRLIKNFASAETLEKTTLGGRECYKVKLVWKSGRESFDCYAVDDGLLVGGWATQESPMGAMEAMSVLSEYKQFGPIRMPTRTVVSVMGMEQVISFETVEFGPQDASKFALPPEVKALIK